jgi:hypothetical protein
LFAKALLAAWPHNGRNTDYSAWDGCNEQYRRIKGIPKKRNRRRLLEKVDEGRKVGGQTSECIRAVKPVKKDPAYSTFISTMHSQTKTWLDAY